MQMNFNFIWKEPATTGILIWIHLLSHYQCKNSAFFHWYYVLKQKTLNMEYTKKLLFCFLPYSESFPNIIYSYSAYKFPSEHSDRTHPPFAFKNASAFSLRGARHAIAWHTSTAHLCKSTLRFGRRKTIVHRTMCACRRLYHMMSFILSKKLITSAIVTTAIITMSQTAKPNRCQACFFNLQQW